MITYNTKIRIVDALRKIGITEAKTGEKKSFGDSKLKNGFEKSKHLSILKIFV